MCVCLCVFVCERVPGFGPIFYLFWVHFGSVLVPFRNQFWAHFGSILGAKLPKKSTKVRLKKRSEKSHASVCRCPREQGCSALKNHQIRGSGDHITPYNHSTGALGARWRISSDIWRPTGRKSMLLFSKLRAQQ